MTPLAHTTHTRPTALEQAGDNGEPPIANLPDEVFVAHIFPYLDSESLGRTGQVCRRFTILSHAVWQRRSQEICLSCAGLLPPFGSTLLGPNPSPAEAAAFLDRTVQRVREIQNSLPEGLRSQFSAHDLVCKVDPGYMPELLQRACDHSLRTVFGTLAHVPEDASLEESVHRIREWLQTAEAGRIQELDLGRRGLCCLPREIGRLTELQRLDLRGNYLVSLPPEIWQLTALRELDLSFNRLASLPSEVGQLTALHKLELSFNRLASLAPEIGRLTVLRKLLLRSNKLTSFPPEIGQLTALQHLDLARNRLDALPPELWQLTALRELELSVNRLASLPSGIGRLRELKTLYLDRNTLNALPPEIGRLTELQELYLNDNRLTSLPSEIERLTELQELYLDGNQLTSLPPKIERLTAPRW